MIGPVGVVAVRQWVAGPIMLTVGRPRLRAFTWWHWRPIMALAASDPVVVTRIAAEAEEAGWHGLFDFEPENVTVDEVRGVLRDGPA